ncbi:MULTISPECIES: hypothetical protein [unclassified Okeania]|uniref:hypothetical protein n=1 Tax=unclassified Okeania TaxID=2634635 RepID=UPI00257F6884|nr:MULTISPECIES: hypothetical protein [unclassified Okeania]
MEPIYLILTALVTGAGEATAGSLVQDIYQNLKGLIRRKFADNSAANMVLEEHEKDPETYEAPLKKKLIEGGIDKDEEVIKKAQELLEKLKPEAAATGLNLKVYRDVKGSIGDKTNIKGGCYWRC